MEALSPLSAVAEPKHRAPARRESGTAGQAEQMLSAPSVKLPLSFMLTGLLALLGGTAWLVVQPQLLATYHYNQNIIALTHLFVLGWICSVVMGAMYQLVPVALETKLYSERLARWQLVFQIVGFAGMVWMFRAWNMKQVGHFGCVFATGIGLFVYNIARTLYRVPRWNITATAVASALAWIAFAAFAGLSIAAGKCIYESNYSPTTAVGALIAGLRSLGAFMSRFDAIGAMHAHAHLGVIGFFTMLIVGVSYKLIPMFTLSEVQNKRRAAASVILLNIGLAGSFVSILLRSRWKLAFALVVIAALVLYGIELTAILRARKRGPLDWGVKYFLTAITTLAPLSALAVVLSWPTLPLNPFTGQLENAYGFVGLIGVVTFAIIGMLYKIIPFLVWFGTYSKHIGKAQVPALADMYSTRLQMLGYWVFVTGMLTTTAGILMPNETIVRVGYSLLAASFVTLAINIGSVLSHYAQPRLKPFMSHAKDAIKRGSESLANVAPLA